MLNVKAIHVHNTDPLGNHLKKSQPFKRGENKAQALQNPPSSVRL